MRVINCALMCVCVALAAGVCCAEEEDAPEVVKAKEKKGKKPNVLELVRPVDELTDEAQALYLEGEPKEALALYRQALEVLQDLEIAHFAWVTSPEFAPLRNRRVFCEKTMDRIMLEDAKANARMMTVSDTQELEKKRAERKKAAAGGDAEAREPFKLGSKGGGGEVAAAAVKPAADGTSDETFQIDEELDMVKDLIQLERFADADRPLLKVLRVVPENREARFLMALSRVRQGKHADALIMLDGLLAEHPMDEAALLLAAGAHTAVGAYGKAIDMLDRAMKANPKRPDALINMTWLLLEMRPGDTTEAEQYYRMAVRMGAARVREIERRLGIKSE